MKLKNPIEIIPQISIENNKCDIYAIFKDTWGNNIHYYIECKDIKDGVGVKTVNEFIYTFESVKKTNSKITQGMLISRNHFSPEARAHGEKAGLILKTFEGLNKSILDFTNHFQNMINKYERKDLFTKNLYIPLSGYYIEASRKIVGSFVPVTINDEIEIEIPSKLFENLMSLKKGSKHLPGRINIELIDAYFQKWLLSKDSSQLLILLGDYGTGKTTILEHFYYLLAKRYLSNLISSNRVPIFIKLNQFTKEYDIGDLVFSLLNRGYGVALPNLTIFEQFNYSGKLLFLLDGFDEMSVLIEPRIKVKHFKEILKLLNRNTKIILTSRTHYFTSDQEIIDLLEKIEDNPDTKDIKYQIIYLNPLTMDDIKLYFARLNLDPTILDRNKHLREICQKPLLLEMVITTLGQLSSNQDFKIAELIQKYTEKWLSHSDERSRMTCEQRLEFCKNLALHFLENRIDKIHHLQFPHMITTLFNLDTHDEVDQFLKDVETSTFLERSPAGEYYFNHNAFYEYFVALKLVDLLTGSDSTKFCQFFNGAFLTEEILQFFKELIDIRELKRYFKIEHFKNFFQIGFNMKASLEILKWLFQKDVFQFGSNELADIFIGGLKHTTELLLNGLNLNIEDLTLIVKNLRNPQKVAYLNLSDNQLTDIQGIINSLEQLSAIQRLYFGNNQIAVIPDALGQLSALQSLSLRNNQIAVIPDALGQLSALQSLSLGNNQIAVIPDAFGQLSALQRLSLRNNQISVIPDALGQLSALQELYVGYNQISVIPDALGQLSALQELYLQNNQISSIPDALGQLSALQELYLQNNQISSIPDALGQLSALQRLYLGNNQISTIPESLLNLPKLNHIQIGGNPLTPLAFKLLKRLEKKGVQVDYKKS